MLSYRSWQIEKHMAGMIVVAHVLLGPGKENKQAGGHMINGQVTFIPVAECFQSKLQLRLLPLLKNQADKKTV